MISQKQPAIALISVHGDPSAQIGKEEAGGQNVYVREVGQALASQGWNVDMFTRRTSAEQAAIVDHGPNCRTIRLTAGPADFIPRDEIFHYLPDFVQAFLTFQKESHLQYSIAHTNYWLSGWVGLRLKEKLNITQFHTYHSVGAVKYNAVDTIPPIGSTRLSVEKDCLEKADCVIATSPQEEDHLRTLVSSKGTIKIVPCGTDIERFGQYSKLEARKQLAAQQQIQLSPEQKVVFYIGRFDKRKGIETLVRAVHGSEEFNPKQDILIIGGGSRPGKQDGDERLRIEGIVASLNMAGYTQFPGRISDELLPLYYAAADIVVVPSHYEPFGLVAIEAMASGTPVIASKVGGLQYTVQHRKTGLVVPPQATEQFALAIDQILADSAWRDALGQAARRRVLEDFSWTGVAAALAKNYDSFMTAYSY